MRRSIALTVAAFTALALSPVGVARAGHEPGHEELVVDVTKPTASEVAGTVDVEVKITETFNARSIKQYWVRFEPAGGGDPFGTFCAETYGEGVDGTVTLRFRWNTNRYPNGETGVATCDSDNPALPPSDASAPLPNGTFRLSAWAKLTDPLGLGDVSRADGADIGVSNAPSTPSGVKLSYKESTDTITVSWNRNPETYDDIDYRVDECWVDRSSKPCGSSDWKKLGEFEGTSMSVKRTKPGIYRFRVAALRPAADGSTMTSAFAGPTGDPTEIEVEDDPTPTSSTVPEASDEEEEQQPEPETRTVVKPTRRVQRAAPQVLQRIVEEDPGFDDELPYGEAGDEGDEEAIGGLPIDEAGEDEGDSQRALLMPLAGGALLLVIALQVHYVNRRAHRALEPLPAEVLSGAVDPED